MAENAKELGLASTVDTAASLTFEIRTRPMIRWAEVAIEHERLAREAREQLVSDHAAGRTLDLASELRAAMVALAASAHSLDALYAELAELVGPETVAKWDERRRGGRGAQVAAVLELSVDVDVAELRPRLKRHFERRDTAVHPRRKSSKPESHPGLPAVAVAREYHDYSVETANESVDLLLDVLMACVESPKPAVEQWAKDARGSIERLQELRG